MQKRIFIILISAFSCTNRTSNAQSTACTSDAQDIIITEGFSAKINQLIAEGYELGEYDECFCEITKNGQHGRIDLNGDVVEPLGTSDVYDMYELCPDENEELGFRQIESNGKFGIENIDGKIVVPCEYDTPIEFKDGMAYVTKDGKYGYVNTSGSLVIPLKFNVDEDGSEFPFTCGLAPFANEEEPWLWGYIDKTGKEAIPCKFQWSACFYEDSLACVGVEDGKLGIIDFKGNLIFKSSYPVYDENVLHVDRVADLFLIDLVVEDYRIENGREIGATIRTGAVNTKGQIVIPFDYAGLRARGQNLICFYKDGEKNDINEYGDYNKYPYGYLDTNGNVLFSCLYRNDAEDLKREEINGKYGYVSRSTGKEIFPCIFEEAEFNVHAVSLVRLNGRQGFVDQYGNSTFSKDDIENAKNALK